MLLDYMIFLFIFIVAQDIGPLCFLCSTDALMIYLEDTLNFL